MAKELFNAICFISKDVAPLKYRGIHNKEKFEKFAKTKGVAYINYYNKKTRIFAGRVYL